MPARVLNRFPWALMGLVVCSLARPARAAPPDDPPDGAAPVAQGPSTQEAAKAAVHEAVAAFASADYATALDRFGAAMALRPSPKLHYNIAVCHFYLMQQATAEEPAAYHKTQAIEGYQRYLEQRPTAPDRPEVEEALASLGAAPRNGLREIDPEDFVPEEEEADIEKVDAPPPLTVTQAPSTFLAHPKKIRLQFGLFLGATPQHWNVQTVGDNLYFSGEIRFSGLVGPKRNGILGVSAGFAIGHDRQRRALVPTYGYVGFEGGGGWTVAKRVRLELTGLVAPARQALRAGTGIDTPPCSLDGDRDQQLVGARWGGLFAVRPSIGVFIDRRQHHEINYQIVPALGVWSRGAQPETCAADRSPHQAAGVGETVIFTIFAGFGYVARF